MPDAGSNRGKISDSNSTNIPLGANGIFVGNFEEISSYSLLSVVFFSDKASAIDGLEFHWSGDGENLDLSEGSSCSANTGRAFAITPRACFFRIKYTNGNQAQSVFRLHTGLHVGGTGLITRP